MMGREKQKRPDNDLNEKIAKNKKGGIVEVLPIVEKTKKALLCFQSKERQNAHLYWLQCSYKSNGKIIYENY